MSGVRGGEMPWPELEWDEWKDDADTLHMWTQIVGKTRLALTPLQNHWWNVPLYVSARGLTTSAMPWRGMCWRLSSTSWRMCWSCGWVRASGPCGDAGAAARWRISMRSIMGRWQRLGVEAKIWPMPVEVADAGAVRSGYRRMASTTRSGAHGFTRC